ncbi:hypothetical protein QJS66_12685 [Kocuria rhizophila]|nr:hypothetical protein QJS66_12685 [Kocuria rhizophila]
MVSGVLLTVIASLGPARRAGGAGTGRTARLPCRGRPARGAHRPRRRRAAWPVPRPSCSAPAAQRGPGHRGRFRRLSSVLTSRAYVPGLVRAGKLLPAASPPAWQRPTPPAAPPAPGATATALLIGVLLVATVLAGQQVARTTLLVQLERPPPWTSPSRRRRAS